MLKSKIDPRHVEEKADAAPESSYHASARIAPPALGKEIGLTSPSQTPEIRAVVSGAIDSITRDCYIDDAYPILSSRVGYSKTHMIKAAQKLPDCVHVLRRLETDPRMSKCLSDLVSGFRYLRTFLNMYLLVHGSNEYASFKYEEERRWPGCWIFQFYPSRRRRDQDSC